MRTIPRLLPVLAVLAALVPGPAARAQYAATFGTGASYAMPQQALLDTMMTGAVQTAAWRNYAKHRSKKGKTTSPRAGAKARGGTARAQKAAARALAMTDFRPLPRRLLVERVSDAQGATAAQKRALARYYTRSLRLLEKQGRKNNLAFALAFLYGASLKVAKDRALPDAEFAALQGAMSEALVALPAFRRLSNRKKQEMYEAALLAGIGLAGFHEAAKEQGNADLLRQTRRGAEDVLAMFDRKQPRRRKAAPSRAGQGAVY